MRPKALVVPIAFILALLAAPPARAQETDLARLLGGRLTIKLRELTPTWRRMRLQLPAESKEEGGGGLMGMMGGLLGGMFGGGLGSAVTPPPPAVYTQGETAAIGGETFLVVYRWPRKQLDMTALMKMDQGGELPPPEVLTPETELTMSLVKLRAIEALNDIRPFNMEREIAESKKAAEAEAAMRKEIEKKGGGGPFGGPGGGPGAGGDVGPVPDLRPTPPAPAKKPAPKPPAKKPARR